jgi:transcriptional regulator with XRE-family HTH domain
VRPKYTESIRKKISDPDATGLGVELGRLCMLHGYSVREVAETFKVSRVTAYNWITGRTKPTPCIRDDVEKLVERLKQKPIPIENE